MEPLLEAPQSINVRERLIEATIRILAEDGPSAVKARTVASASGLSTMVLYTHFGGIPELLAAVIDQGFRKLADGFSRVELTDDPVADLCSMALTARHQARANPHLYDLMFGLSTRATYRPAKDACPRSGLAPAFLDAYEHVIAGCGRLVESGRVDQDDPKVVAAQLWSLVHGFVTLELADHFAEFADPAADVLLRLGTNLAVGFGDDRARAVASHEAAARALGIFNGD